MTRSHLQPRRKKIYSNNSVYSPNGLLMFRCSDQKLLWYIKRNLAEPIPPNLYSTPDAADPAQAVRLLFEPKGTGRNRPGDGWYLEDQQEICVVCGHEGVVNDEQDERHDSSASRTNKESSTSSCSEMSVEEIGLTLHHVVPYQYRREMPLSFKSHGSHDVLVLCVTCHEYYEQYADLEKRRLCKIYNAPLIGRGWLKYPEHGPIRAGASALLRYKAQIPASRIAELEAHIKDFFDLDDTEAISDDVLTSALELKSLEKGPDFQEHGQIVISTILEKEGEEGLARFVKFWRQHFLDHLRPQFLSKQWKVDDPVNLVAGEYNPYRPEMDGS